MSKKKRWSVRLGSSSYATIGAHDVRTYDGVLELVDKNGKVLRAFAPGDVGVRRPGPGQAVTTYEVTRFNATYYNTHGQPINTTTTKTYYTEDTDRD